MNYHNDCERYFADGGRYLQTALRGRRRASVFTSTMVYHILCLSIEKFLMGIFCYHHAIPEHNTLSHMVHEAAHFADIPQDLIEQITAMDRVVNLCDPAAPLQAELTEMEVEPMLEAGKRIHALIAGYMHGPFT